MKYVRILLLLMVSAMAVASTTSCSKESSKESSLLGTWTAFDDEVFFEYTFSKGGNGTVAVTVEKTTFSGSITWSLNGDELTIICRIIDEDYRKKSSFIGKTLTVELVEGTFVGKTLTIGGTEFTKKKK